MDRTVGTYYYIKRKLGAGSFGKIYLVEHTLTHELYAAKFEPINSPAPQLSYEAKLYNKFAGGSHIPMIHWTGIEKNHRIMVIDLLGSSLEDLFQKYGQKLSLKTVLMLADQMLSAIQYIHNKNYLHRDIKPDNFMIGTGSNSTRVFSIDFGLCKRYRDDITHEHINYVEGKSLTGTARYASIGALRGREQSRRDDLESLGYVWIYLIKGKLPWMGLNGTTREDKYQKIARMKEETPIHTLCSELPAEFQDYMIYVRNLGFAENPDYTYLRNLLKAAFRRYGFKNDQVYEWNTQKITVGKENLTPFSLAPRNKELDEIRDRGKSPRYRIDYQTDQNRDDEIDFKGRHYLYRPQRTSTIRAKGTNEYRFPCRPSKLPLRRMIC